MKKSIVLIMMFLALVSFVSAQDSPKKALLAMEKTKFKEALIEEMKKGLEAESIEVTVVEKHKKELENYKASDFDYVFITNSGVGSKVRPWIRKWLEENNNSSNILLHTTKTKKWDEKVEVDSVSSASAVNEAAELADKYIRLLLDK